MAEILGLTGSIASGKSTVSSFFKKMGYPVVDADLVARKLVLPGMPVNHKLKSVFGSAVFEGSTLNRKKLGQLVFSDPQKLTLLNQIMQPAIRTEITRQLRKYQGEKLVVLDAALLLEQGYQKLVDKVMVVSILPELQVQRLMARDRLPLKEAKQRISSQWSQEKKLQLADIVIDNSSSVEETQHQVLKWLDNSKLR